MQVECGVSTLDRINLLFTLQTETIVANFDVTAVGIDE